MRDENQYIFMLYFNYNEFRIETQQILFHYSIISTYAEHQTDS